MYFYRVPPGLESEWDGKKKFPLGRVLHEAYAVWAQRLKSKIDADTVSDLLDRYLLEVVPRKAPKSRIENARHIKLLRIAFGRVPLADMKPQQVYQYVDRRKGKVAAHREIEVLSHAYTKAVEWGLIDRHPFKGEVRLTGEAPRTRYVEDWEIVECLSIDPRQKKGSVRAIQAYIRIKLLTGMAQGDLLRLQPARQFRDDGIHVQRHKTRGTTGKRTIYEWSPDLRAAVAMALSARPVDISPWLFCTRCGECYINEATGEARGWRSMWQRFMARVMAETEIKERFTEHDLRAKAGSDAESLEKARAMLAHADVRMTERAYRRKPERVKTLRTAD